MSGKDVLTRSDLENIVARFYESVLVDPIIGFIFTDIAKIDLEKHLPLIVDFWSDIVLDERGSSGRRYQGNALRKHLELNQKIPLKAGHFTRWLYLFNGAVDLQHQGPKAALIKQRAEMVANSISAAITDRKKGDMNLVLR